MVNILFNLMVIQGIFLFSLYTVLIIVFCFAELERKISDFHLFLVVTLQEERLAVKSLEIFFLFLNLLFMSSFCHSVFIIINLRIFCFKFIVFHFLFSFKMASLNFIFILTIIFHEQESNGSHRTERERLFETFWSQSYH